MRHAGSDNSAENIADVVTYLLSDYSFLSRKSLCRIFKLCYLVIRRPACDFPAVSFSLKDCAVPESVVSSCLRGEQSYVCSANFKVRSLFTQHTMECVRDSISEAWILWPRPLFSTHELVYVRGIALALSSVIQSYSVLIWIGKRKPFISVF